MTSRKLEIKYVPINDVKPWDRNPKKHNKKAILESFKRFKPTQPLLVQKGTGLIIAGHGRLEAFKELGYAEVPIIELEMNDAEARAYALVDNQTVIAGGWDDDLLLSNLQELNLELPELDMSIFGFSDKQTGKKAEEDDFDVDASLDADVEPITKPGDVIKLGDHRLMCGDSTKREDVEKLMNGTKAVMIHTDPPYNVNYGSTKNIIYKKAGCGVAIGERGEESMIANDNMSTEAWESFCKAIYAIYKEFCVGDIYQWGAPGPEGMRSRIWLVEAGCHWSATIVWAKDSIVLSPANYQRQYEPCFYGWFDKSSFNNKMNDGADRKGLTELWTFPKPHISKLHPTMKPVELCGYAIQNSSKPGDIVLDLFGGSGSTLIACEQLNRRCYMMELDPRYCDVIVQRWEEYTGKKAVRP
jgi:site-specific DNA-methyltransferase (adenine-specific)